LNDASIREAIQKRIRKMSDEQLLRYGQAAKFMCSREANLGPRKTFVSQLREARDEWKRRHPAPPLKDSF
jgi:hypothetical protein